MTKKLVKSKIKSKSRNFPMKGLLGRLEEVFSRNKKVTYPEYKAGDTVKVHVKIKEGTKERIQIFEGVVIRKSNASNAKSFTVRKVSHGVGVERIFQENTPKIAKFEVVNIGKIRRAKLYYLRDKEGKAAKIENDIVAEAARKEKGRSVKKAEKPEA